MSGLWSFVLTDANGNALAELSTASGRTISGKRNSYWEVGLTMSHEDDATALLLSALTNTGVPRLKAYRKGPNDSSGVLRFRGPLMGLQEASEEDSLLTATFRSPFSVLVGDGDKTGRFLTSQFPTIFSATDAGTIATSLVDTANRDSPTGLATNGALVTATVARDRQYPVAQNIGAAITDLTSVLDGFDFYESFVESGTLTTTSQAGGPTSFTESPFFSTAWGAPTGNYYWVVTAIVGGVETTPSAEIALFQTQGSTASPQFHWAGVPGATSYNLYRSTVTGGEAVTPALVANTALHVFVDTGADVTAGAITTALTPWNAEAFVNIVSSQGQVQPNARFEYGPKTAANVSHLDRTTVPPQNSVLVTGGNGLISLYSDAASVAKYRKWWCRMDLSAVVEQATLDAKALALARPNPVKTISFVPELGLDSCPKPFDDFGIGDTVTLFASRSSLSENTQLRVNGFTVPIDENGFETVSVDNPTTREEDDVLTASLIAEVVV